MFQYSSITWSITGSDWPGFPCVCQVNMDNLPPVDAGSRHKRSAKDIAAFGDYTFEHVKASSLNTYITIEEKNTILVVRNVQFRLVITLPEKDHNLRVSRFYIIVQSRRDDNHRRRRGAEQQEAKTYGILYFRQDQPHIDLFVFFSVFFSCFFLFLALCVMLWKVKQAFDARRSRQLREREMECMASRPFAKVLVLVEPDDCAGGVTLTSGWGWTGLGLGSAVAGVWATHSCPPSTTGEVAWPGPCFACITTTTTTTTITLPTTTPTPWSCRPATTCHPHPAPTRWAWCQSRWSRRTMAWRRWARCCFSCLERGRPPVTCVWGPPSPCASPHRSWHTSLCRDAAPPPLADSCLLFPSLSLFVLMAPSCVCPLPCPEGSQLSLSPSSWLPAVSVPFMAPSCLCPLHGSQLSLSPSWLLAVSVPFMAPSCLCPLHGS